MQKDKIVIVEDEKKIAHLLADYLEIEDFQTILVHDGNHALSTIEEHNPALVLLDLMLPNTDGLTICRELRKTSNVPIILLTARVDEMDRLTGLDLGADDYICKPFLPREVVARVKAILRRVQQSPVQQNTNEPDKNKIKEYKMLSLNEELFQCHFYDQLIELTPLEFRMLQTLVSHPGKVYSREELMQGAYQDNRVVSDRTIDSHIKNIRKKLAKIQKKTAPQDEEIIQSIYGIGYRVS